MSLVEDASRTKPAPVADVPLVDPDDIAAFQAEGACCLRGLFTDWVEELRGGVARNMAEPGPYGAENTKPGEAGRFFDDYCTNGKRPAKCLVVSKL